MKPHKHAELIKAWADGAEIEFRYVLSNHREIVWSEWFNANLTPAWSEDYEFRIKPEPKPDVVKYLLKDTVMGDWSEYNCIPKGARFDICVKLTFDGETGELKSAEVLK